LTAYRGWVASWSRLGPAAGRHGRESMPRPRRLRTTHASLISEILNLLSGRIPAARPDGAEPPGEARHIRQARRAPPHRGRQPARASSGCYQRRSSVREPPRRGAV
jgi:hypothetical protein